MKFLVQERLLGLFPCVSFAEATDAETSNDEEKFYLQISTKMIIIYTQNTR